MMEIQAEQAQAIERLDKEMSEYIRKKEMENDKVEDNIELWSKERACKETIHGASRSRTPEQQPQQQMSSIYNNITPEMKPGRGSSPLLGIPLTPYTGGTDVSTKFTAERFREQIDQLTDSFAESGVRTIPVPHSLRPSNEPPGLGTVVKLEASTQIVAGAIYPLSRQRGSHTAEEVPNACCRAHAST